jgi:hypothetical protein
MVDVLIRGCSPHTYEVSALILWSEFGDILITKVADEAHLMDLRRRPAPLCNSHFLCDMITKREEVIGLAPAGRTNRPSASTYLMSVVMRFGIVNDQ